jgi:hypothetical protein
MPIRIISGIKVLLPEYINARQDDAGNRIGTTVRKTVVSGSTYVLVRFFDIENVLRSVLINENHLKHITLHKECPTCTCDMPSANEPGSQEDKDYEDEDEDLLD